MDTDAHSPNCKKAAGKQTAFDPDCKRCEDDSAKWIIALRPFNASDSALRRKITIRAGDGPDHQRYFVYGRGTPDEFEIEIPPGDQEWWLKIVRLVKGRDEIVRRLRALVVNMEGMLAESDKFTPAQLKSVVVWTNATINTILQDAEAQE